MAAPAPSQRPQGSGAGPSATWARSGEPGSAFSGTSRGRGRGSGRGRGGRGPRGGARESKPIGADSSDKANTTPKSTSTPATKPVSLPPPATNDKPSAPSPAPASTRPKGPPRRASRTIPAVVIPQLNGTSDAPSSPSNSRPQNRRRRSQSGKTPTSTLPKINVPAHDDNLLRTHRYRGGPVPHTAPIKDTPPHLSPPGPFDMRNNIDALVERVRAVAMADNRPSTPGSHIDWAGDDDDSLPDLDDWGVSTTTSTAGKVEVISPLGLPGLTPLPDVDLELHTSPSLSKLSDIPLEATPNDTLAAKVSINASQQGRPSNRNVAPPSSSKSRLIHVTTLLSTIPLKDNSSEAPAMTTQQNLVSAPASAKVTLQHALPQKPAVTTDVSTILPNSRQDPSATSMQKHSISTPKLATEKVAPQPSEAVPTVKIETSADEQTLAESAPLVPATKNDKEDPFASLLARDGLVASIHAPTPGEVSETMSAPSNMSSYPTTITSENRTHTRAHTVGRPFPRPDNGRPSRSGINASRGGLTTGGGYHSRTHSSPPAGLHNHRSPAHRPVITGDAISRLARTIGNTTVSPGRATSTLAAAHD